jgi:hypothetical protein
MLPLQHQTKAQGIALLQQFKRSISIPCTRRSHLISRFQIFTTAQNAECVLHSCMSHTNLETTKGRMGVKILCSPFLPSPIYITPMSMIILTCCTAVVTKQCFQKVDDDMVSFESKESDVQKTWRHTPPTLRKPSKA